MSSPEYRVELATSLGIDPEDFEVDLENIDLRLEEHRAQHKGDDDHFQMLLAALHALNRLTRNGSKPSLTEWSQVAACKYGTCKASDLESTCRLVAMLGVLSEKDQMLLATTFVGFERALGEAGIRAQIIPDLLREKSGAYQPEMVHLPRQG